MKGKTNTDFSKENQLPAVGRPPRGPSVPEKISLIVPIYNEARGLPAFLAHLDRLFFHEIIVVDGGSRDRSPEILAAWARDPAQTQSGAGRRIVISAPRGRGKQMNAGAKAASGGILLFLHADTRLPAGALDGIRGALDAERCAGGAFHLRIDSPQPFLKAIARLANLRSRLLKLPYGDQGYFVRGPVFEALGGYPEIPLMEDVEFFRRLKRKGKIVLLKKAVTTSARRWQGQGPALTTGRNIVILGLYWLGIPPGRLAKWYHASSRYALPLDRPSGEEDRIRQAKTP